MSTIIVVKRNTEVQKRVTSVCNTPYCWFDSNPSVKTLGSQMVRQETYLFRQFSVFRITNIR